MRNPASRQWSSGKCARISLPRSSGTRRFVLLSLSLSGRVRSAVSTNVLKLTVTNPHVFTYVNGFRPRTTHHRRIPGVLGVSLALRTALSRPAPFGALLGCNGIFGECHSKDGRFEPSVQRALCIDWFEHHSIHRRSSSTSRSWARSVTLGSPPSSLLSVDRNDDWKDAATQSQRGGEPTLTKGAME